MKENGGHDIEIEFFYKSKKLEKGTSVSDLIKMNSKSSDPDKPA